MDKNTENILIKLNELNRVVMNIMELELLTVEPHSSKEVNLKRNIDSLCKLFPGSNTALDRKSVGD